MSSGPQSFLAWTKEKRAKELLARLPASIRETWDYPRLFALLKALGLTQPRQYLEAGWWVPEPVRRDVSRADALRKRVDRAMAQRQLPPPDAEYTWDDVRRLVELCGFTPQQLLEQLAHVYALTMGEDIFVRAVAEVAEAGPWPGSHGEASDPH